MGLTARQTPQQRRDRAGGLHVIRGAADHYPATPPAPWWEAPSQWGGFVAIDMHREELVTRARVARMLGTISAALGVERGASPHCEGTVVIAVFDVPDNSSDSYRLLDRVTASVADEFPDSELVRASIDFCDPEAVQVDVTPSGTTVRIVPTMVR